MKTYRVMLKSGRDFNVVCENCNILKNPYGELVGYEFAGVVENDPIYLDFSQVDAIIEERSDEPATVVLRGLDEAASITD